ncbi:sigma-70 family RNA polymerase sigma factor [Paramaledivibacter caminithermalis]|jgi:RNA polymerase sigma factor for flagellar operon FliA|uniref:RNA polymerase sigma factor n=1 Tax=Paramaledivibacter caminithermalis (strain DSM 15212 / CIP 107654 / DViRD3) TaxID=1121301 RepID=A0A1M6N6C9_PARC5|nr:FliA/WhiG family RNA polymerase sigma factor [Paramaledivibacter caminithermalis]SHJ91249.1 RNA polymerase, sigma 28 subunit, SigD/FliA/WhiG [Paramaledivibacter caminithermalis DSM 15212]
MANNELLKLYKKSKSKEIKDQLIVENIELVKIIAGRLYHSYNTNLEYDDIVSYGILGLIDAIDKFDPDKNVKFETYANFRIRGSIIDHLRSLDWVPRSIRQKHKKFEEVVSKLQSIHGLDIDDEILAKELNMSLEEFKNFLSEVSIFSVVSLDDKMSENTNFNIISQDTETRPESSYIQNETKKILLKTIDRLPEREKMIIKLYYFSELTYKEISKILNISESRVSQIHTKCIAKLKSSLNSIYT